MYGVNAKRNIIKEEIDDLAFEKSPAIESAKYLIQLYSSTKYSCDRQKIQKIIIFAHFALLLNSKEGLLGDEPITATYKGLGIDSVSKLYYNLLFDGIDENKKIDDYNLKKNEDFIVKYQYDEDFLSVEKRDMLLYFFECFGAYSGEILTAITRKFSLYNNEINYWELPNGKMYINERGINKFIRELQCKYENMLGDEIIEKEITSILDSFK